MPKIKRRKTAKQAKWELTPEKFIKFEEADRLREITEAKAAADAAKGKTTWPKIWMTVDLALNTGMRVAELANIKLSDLNLKAINPYIQVIGKGGRKRQVYIDNGLISHIKQHIMENQLTEDGYLLTSNQTGRQYTTMGLQLQFHKAVRMAGLPEDYSIHAARHYHGTYLFDQTKNMRLVQKQLGHVDISTTAIYADVLEDEMSRAVNDAFTKKDEDEAK